MVKHVILWKLKDEVADKTAVMCGIKEGLGKSRFRSRFVLTAADCVAI